MPARFVCGICAVAPDKPERQRIRHVQRTHAVGRWDHRDLQPVRELGKLARGLRQRDTVADEDDGPLRFENEVDARRYFVGRGAAALRIERRRRRRDLDVILFLKNIERHIDIHGAGPARQHGRRRLA